MLTSSPPERAWILELSALVYHCNMPDCSHSLHVLSRLINPTRRCIDSLIHQHYKKFASFFPNNIRSHHAGTCHPFFSNRRGQRQLTYTRSFFYILILWKKYIKKIKAPAPAVTCLHTPSPCPPTLTPNGAASPAILARCYFFTRSSLKHSLTFIFKGCWYLIYCNLIIRLFIIHCYTIMKIKIHSLRF